MEFQQQVGRALRSLIAKNRMEWLAGSSHVSRSAKYVATTAYCDGILGTWVVITYLFSHARHNATFYLVLEPAAAI